MDSVAEFLDESARLLVPTCDAVVVRDVFARASAGYAGPRGRDGRRVSAITPSGVPFEASITCGGGRSARALRYVTETATAMPFFGPRLAAQRGALDDLVRWLPAPARSSSDELRAAIDVLFPEPAAAPARTRFATMFGIVHDPEVPRGVAGLKLYGNVRVDGLALARLGRWWPAFDPLRAQVEDLPFVVPHFVAVEVDASGRLKHKLYLRTRRANAAAVALLARRFGADAAATLPALGQLGVQQDAWRRPFFVCCETVPDGEHEPAVSLHLSARALGLAPAAMARLAQALVERHGDDGGLDALGALHAAARRAGGTWVTTVIGIGLATDRDAGKVNVYMAPGDPRERGAHEGPGVVPGEAEGATTSEAW